MVFTRSSTAAKDKDNLSRLLILFSAPQSLVTQQMMGRQVPLVAEMHILLGLPRITLIYFLLN